MTNMTVPIVVTFLTAIAVILLLVSDSHCSYECFVTGYCVGILAATWIARIFRR